MRIYLDHNATTPVRDEVADAMDRATRECFGNPSSVHAEGAAARAAVERARAQVASLLCCAPGDVLFTGGASEANNTALLRVGEALPGRHLVTTNVEHPSIEAPLETLADRGWRITRLPVDAGGRVGAESVSAALEDDTALVSLIWANNETGVLLPLAEIAQAVAAHPAKLHVDATQAVGKWPLDLARVPIDLLSLTGHKFGGPKGVGALVVRGVPAFEPLLRGGPQEGRRRAGTENVAGIVGLGAACALAERELPERVRRYAELRDRLWAGIQAKVPDVRRNGDPEHVLPNTLNVTFLHTAGELLLQALDLEGVAVSSGAACSSGSIEPSRVLVALGLSPEDARGTLRFSVGHGNDEAQIDRVLALLPDLLARVREAEPV
ncbi:MAG: cysteine desulfurase family protein [Myxococcota bacterium]